jgi:hypothetical protein
MNEERRPHLQRNCPVKGCDWKQVTSWFVGGPHRIETVSMKTLELQATAHLLQVHSVPTLPTIIT